MSEVSKYVKASVVCEKRHCMNNFHQIYVHLSAKHLTNTIIHLIQSRVTELYLQGHVMMSNKYAKFRSNSMFSFEKKPWMENLNHSCNADVKAKEQINHFL